MTATETGPDGRERVQRDGQAWRAWLDANEARADGVWLASWRAATGARG